MASHAVWCRTAASARALFQRALDNLLLLRSNFNGALVLAARLLLVAHLFIDTTLLFALLQPQLVYNDRSPELRERVESAWRGLTSYICLDTICL